MNIPKIFQEAGLILSGECPECTKTYMRTRIHDKIKNGFLKGEGYSQPVSHEEDYSHLVRDGRFLSGKPLTTQDKKNNKQAKSGRLQYKQEGYASWYDSWFHGRQTSSGVEYDEDEYSAAHRTLW